MIHKQITFASVGYGWENDNKENNETESKGRERVAIVWQRKEETQLCFLKYQVAKVKKVPLGLSREFYSEQTLIPVD